jgi:hypothetical protein
MRELTTISKEFNITQAFKMRNLLKKKILAIQSQMDSASFEVETTDKMQNFHNETSKAQLEANSYFLQKNIPECINDFIPLFNSFGVNLSDSEGRLDITKVTNQYFDLIPSIQELISTINTAIDEANVSNRRIIHDLESYKASKAYYEDLIEKTKDFKESTEITEYHSENSGATGRPEAYTKVHNYYLYMDRQAIKDKLKKINTKILDTENQLSEANSKTTVKFTNVFIKAYNLVIYNRKDSNPA